MWGAPARYRSLSSQELGYPAELRALEEWVRSLAGEVVRGLQERPSRRLCVLAFQPRGEAKAVDGGKPEQRGKERRLEHKHPAIGGSDQPGHAAAENQLEDFAAPVPGARFLITDGGHTDCSGRPECPLWVISGHTDKSAFPNNGRWAAHPCEHWLSAYEYTP